MSENQQPNHDPLDEAIGAFQRMSVPERPPDAEVLAQLGAHHGAAVQTVSIPSPPKRRHLMRILVPSAAAVLLAAGGLALLVLNSMPSVALADVIKAAEKHKLVKYKQKLTTTTSDGRTATGEHTVFADLSVPRFRREMRHDFMDLDDRGKSIEEITLDIADFSKERHLITNTHPGSSGGKLPPRKDAWLGRAANKDYKPMLEALRDLQKKDGVTSGKDALDGRETIRFRYENDQEIENATVTTVFWIDTKTKLPIREEIEIVFSSGMTNRYVCTDYEWDPELPKGIKTLDELFSTTPPQGYTLDDQTQTDK